MNYDNNYNPFEGKRPLDFYDEIALKDMKRTVSRSHVGVTLLTLVPMLLILIADIILLSVMGVDNYVATVGSSPVYSMLMGSLPIYAVGVPIFYAVTRKLPTRKIPFVRNFSAKDFLMFIPISFAFMYIGSLISSAIDNLMYSFTGSGLPHSTEQIVDSAPVWLVLIITCLVAPVFEELVFRKIMIDRLSVFGANFAILVSAASFALFHSSLSQMFYAFLVGYILGIIAVKSGNWLYSVGMHIIMNLLGAGIPLLIGGHIEAYENAMNAYIEGNADAFADNIQSVMVVGSVSMLNMLLLIGGCILTALMVRRGLFKISSQCEIALPKERVASTIFTSPGVIIFLIYTVAVIVMDILLHLGVI